jgi:hypothetical protein
MAHIPLAGAGPNLEAQGTEGNEDQLWWSGGGCPWGPGMCVPPQGLDEAESYRQGAGDHGSCGRGHREKA